MDAKIVLFLVGSGGNFLNRVLTLDPNVVPLGGYKNGNFISAIDRAKIYHYDKILEKINPFDFNKVDQDHLTKWVTIELKELYFPLSIGMEKLIELNQLVIEMVHPHHWEEKKCLFGPDDNLDLFYIDIQNCEQWVANQKLHKVFFPGTSPTYALETVKHDHESMIKMVQEYQCRPISLERIIAGIDSFVDEYQRICKMMGVKSYDDLAKDIYLSWQSTWKIT